MTRKIQSVTFDTNRWTVEAATRWMADQEMDPLPMTILGDHTMRYEMFPKLRGVEHSFENEQHTMPEGVVATTCLVDDAEAASTLPALSTVPDAGVDRRTVRRPGVLERAGDLNVHHRGALAPQALVRKADVWEIAGVNKRQRTVDAWISTEARDRMGDVIRADGWQLAAYKRNPVVLFAHSYWDPPVGKAVDIEVRGRRLWSRTQFAETEMGNELFALYADKVMSAFSVGFRPLEWQAQYEQEEGGDERFVGYEFLKQELLEYSAVPVPANQEALVAATAGGRFRSVARALHAMARMHDEDDRTPAADEGHPLASLKTQAADQAAAKELARLSGLLTG